jgi:ATP-dependent DNA helicase RecG
VARDWVAARARRAADRGGDGRDEEEAAARRLSTMLATTDGFRIAEADLALRGPGDFFGTRQSGLPAFRVADVLADRALLEQARTDAFAIVESDPQLRAEAHRSLADHLRRSAVDDLHLLRTG